MHRPTAEPARKTNVVANELQSVSSLRAAVVQQRAELDRDLAEAVTASVRAGTTAAYERIHMRAAALRDLAGSLAEREAALNGELRLCEAWDRDAPERAARAAAEREREKIAANPANAETVVLDFLREVDPTERHWRGRSGSAMSPSAIAQMPGCRRGGAGEPFAIVVDAKLLDSTLRQHRDKFLRGGAQGVLDAIARERLGSTPWQTPGAGQHVSII